MHQKSDIGDVMNAYAEALPDDRAIDLMNDFDSFSVNQQGQVTNLDRLIPEFPVVIAELKGTKVKINDLADFAGDHPFVVRPTRIDED